MRSKAKCQVGGATMGFTANRLVFFCRIRLNHVACIFKRPTGSGAPSRLVTRLPRTYTGRAKTTATHGCGKKPNGQTVSLRSVRCAGTAMPDPLAWRRASRGSGHHWAHNMRGDSPHMTAGFSSRTIHVAAMFLERRPATPGSDAAHLGLVSSRRCGHKQIILAHASQDGSALREHVAWARASVVL